MTNDDPIDICDLVQISTETNRTEHGKMGWDDDTTLRKYLVDADYFNTHFKRDFEHFEEDDITFPPTFRYNEKGELRFRKGGLTTNYIVPGYSDRILHSGSTGSTGSKYFTKTSTEDNSYIALPLAGSEHLPVRNSFKFEDTTHKLVVYTYNLSSRATINAEFIRHIAQVSEHHFVVVLFQELNTSVNVQLLRKQMRCEKVFTGCHSPRHGHSLAIFTNIGFLQAHRRHNFGLKINKCRGNHDISSFTRAKEFATRNVNYQGFIRMSIYKKGELIASIYNIHAPAYDSVAQREFFSSLQFDMKSAGIKRNKRFTILAGDFNSRSLIETKNIEGTKHSKNLYDKCGYENFKKNIARSSAGHLPHDILSNTEVNAQTENCEKQLKEQKVMGESIQTHIIQQFLEFYSKGEDLYEKILRNKNYNVLCKDIHSSLKAKCEASLNDAARSYTPPDLP